MQLSNPPCVITSITVSVESCIIIWSTIITTGKTLALKGVLRERIMSIIIYSTLD